MGKSVGKSPFITKATSTSFPAPQGRRMEKRVTERDLGDQFARLTGELGRVLDQFDIKSRAVRLRSVEGAGKTDSQLSARVKGRIAARASRAHFFPTDLFADPAWSILLELYLANLEQRRTTISRLCVSAEVPATTALRWITAMVDRGLLVRIPDKLDRRRVYIELSPESLLSMANYFEATDPF